jgi:hypothetical protein
VLAEHVGQSHLAALLVEEAIVARLAAQGSLRRCSATRSMLRRSSISSASSAVRALRYSALSFG